MSSSCSTLVSPPGIMVKSIRVAVSRSLAWSVKWPLKLSRTRRAFYRSSPPALLSPDGLYPIYKFLRHPALFLGTHDYSLRELLFWQSLSFESDIGRTFWPVFCYAQGFHACVAVSSCVDDVLSSSSGYFHFYHETVFSSC